MFTLVGWIIWPYHMMGNWLVKGRWTPLNRLYKLFARWDYILSSWKKNKQMLAGYLGLDLWGNTKSILAGNKTHSKLVVMKLCLCIVFEVSQQLISIDSACWSPSTWGYSSIIIAVDVYITIYIYNAVIGVISQDMGGFTMFVPVKNNDSQLPIIINHCWSLLTPL